MPYTLGQAAKATGRSKPTIQRAIKNGSLSAAKAIDGSYEIDPAELHRIFPPANDTGNAEQHLKQNDTPSDTHALQREVGVLRERLADKDGVIEDLRRRLDQSEQERRDKDRQLTALLTDQRPEKQEPPPAKRRWRLWGRG